MKLRYAVIGTGGVGGYYGGRLAQAEHDIHFLFRSDYEQVTEHGLQVDSVKGGFHLPKVNAYKSTAEMPKVDVVLVCLKTTANAELPELLRPLLGEKTVVVLLQNGLGIEQQLSNQLPGVSIAGATAFICSSKVGPAHINHAQYGEITLAPLCGDCKDVLRTVCEDFTAANVPAHYSDSLNDIRWRKLVWNIPYNGLSVVLNTSTDQLTRQPAARALLVDLMNEVIDGAAACGVKIDRKYVDQMLAFTEAMTPYLPSMRLDYDNGRPMEITTMYANPVRAAREAGFYMRKVEMLMQQLVFLEETLDWKLPY